MPPDIGGKLFYVVRRADGHTVHIRERCGGRIVKRCNIAIVRNGESKRLATGDFTNVTEMPKLPARVQIDGNHAAIRRHPDLGFRLGFCDRLVTDMDNQALCLWC